jgi:hypothetical protein
MISKIELKKNSLMPFIIVRNQKKEKKKEKKHRKMIFFYFIIISQKVLVGECSLFFCLLIVLSNLGGK